ncbi:MAG: hypothetical protein KDD94_13780 [Calditrichaeota bacterium]|nr:hypothetical protein [Calditrichota bacterium]
MDFVVFKALAFWYTTLIVCGTMFVPNYIVISKILLLKENLLFNPESKLPGVDLLPGIKAVTEFNSLPEKDLDLVEKTTLFSKAS